MALTPQEASARGSIAAHSMWANTVDRTGRTAALRRGFLEKLQREARERLGPAATDAEVAKSAENALKEHYARMRLNSLKARKKAVQDRQQAAAEALAGEILAGGEESEEACAPRTP